MIITVEQKERLTKLLSEVQDWMVLNDLEWSDDGSIVYDKLDRVINELNNPDEYNTITKSFRS